MTKQQQLEQLQQARNGVIILMANAKQTAYDTKVLPIVQSATTYKMKIKNIGSKLCDVGFDLDDRKKEFGLDFTISLDWTTELLRFNHGWINGETEEQRKYLIERDRIIGKLWDKETELTQALKDTENANKDLMETCNKLDFEIMVIRNQIDEEERKEVIAMLTIGSKWVEKWDLNTNKEHRRPMTIDKITAKMVYFHKPYCSYADNRTRMKLNEMVYAIKKGDIVKDVEENNKSE